MNKQSLVATRKGMLNTLAYMAGAGMLTGGALSAWNALSRHFERKKQEESQKNMIVVELPAERLSKESEGNDKVPNSKISIPRVRKEGTTRKDIKLTYNTQRRSTDGQFGGAMSKNSIDNSGTPSGVLPRTEYALGSILGGGAAFVGGYSIMTALYNKLKERRMSQEAEEYRQKYIKTILEKGAAGEKSQGNVVSNTAANAADFVWRVLRGGAGAVATGANAIGSTANVLNWLEAHNLDPESAAATAGGVLASLGLGTSAFLTKKYLDAKLGDKTAPLDVVPRRKRIVFRAATPIKPTAPDVRPETAPELPYEAGTEKESHDLFLAALSVEMIKQANGAEYFLSSFVKEALCKEGFKEDVLYKAAMNNENPLDLDCLDSANIQGMLISNVLELDPCAASLMKLANEKDAGMLDEIGNTVRQDITNTFIPPMPEAPVVDPLQGAVVKEEPTISQKNDVPLPNLSTEDFLVVADNPQVAEFLAKNRAAVSKRLKVPRPKRKKETSNASRKQVPAEADGDGARLPEG